MKDLSKNPLKPTEHDVISFMNFARYNLLVIGDTCFIVLPPLAVFLLSCDSD